MRKHFYSLVGIAAIVAMAIVFSVQPGTAQGRGQAAPEPPLTNIQILKGMTRPQVLALMANFRDQLGVRCRYCHVVQENDETNYIPDDKQEKLTARKMIQMVQVINDQEFFKTGNRKVECYTCHRGAAKIPVAPPPPPPAAR